MSKRRALRVGLAAVVCPGVAALGYDWWANWRGPAYRGRPAAQWAREIRHWHYQSVPYSATEHLGVWFREPARPWWAECLAGVGYLPKDYVVDYTTQYWLDMQRPDMPLLERDPEAVPVLLELLRRPEDGSRMVAAQGLGLFGPPARAAVPALLAARTDQGGEAGRWAEWALFRIDPETAQREGLREDGLPAADWEPWALP
jgi:hypothetical protein